MRAILETQSFTFINIVSVMAKPSVSAVMGYCQANLGDYFYSRGLLHCIGLNAYFASLYASTPRLKQTQKGETFNYMLFWLKIFTQSF